MKKLIGIFLLFIMITSFKTDSHYPCHPLGDLGPCTHPMHILGDQGPCQHINMYGYAMHSYDLYPCTHAMHYAGDLYPCVHICY
jgi:hypothetical protein